MAESLKKKYWLGRGKENVKKKRRKNIKEERIRKGKDNAVCQK